MTECYIPPEWIQWPCPLPCQHWLQVLFNVASQQHFSHCDSPDMQFMNCNNFIHLTETSFNPLGINFSWSALHKNLKYTSQHCDSSAQHYCRKSKCANQINNFPMRSTPYNCSTNHQPNTLNWITYYAKVSPLNIDVALLIQLSTITWFMFVKERFMDIWFLCIMTLTPWLWACVSSTWWPWPQVTHSWFPWSWAWPCPWSLPNH